MEDLFADYRVYEYILLGLMSFIFLVQLFYYLVYYAQVPAFRGSKIAYTDKKEPVSVVICAKNESENLSNNLPLILEQDYPDYEVVVVNDCSDDDSQDVLEEFQKKYSHLKVTQIKHDEKFTHGKKLALTIGIKAAKNDWLLLTDADCKPEGNKWISTMQRSFTPTNQIVLGYGGYYQEKGFLNKLIRYETFFIALQYLSFAIRKIPYMGVGRNLAYRKSLFMQNKGFASHAHLFSGDDDLFINEVATGKNTLVEFSLRAHTRSVPKKSFNSWVLQKRRHLSSGNLYKLKHKILLGSELFSRLLFYLFVLLLLVDYRTWYVGLAFFVIRVIVQLWVFAKAMRKLNEKKIFIFSIIFDFVLPFLHIYLYITNTINSKQFRWK